MLLLIKKNGVLYVVESPSQPYLTTFRIYAGELYLINNFAGYAL